MSMITAENSRMQIVDQPENGTARVKLNIGGREVEVEVVLFTPDLVNAIREVQKQLRAAFEQGEFKGRTLPSRPATPVKIE